MKKKLEKFNNNLNLDAELKWFRKYDAIYWAKKGEKLPINLFHFINQTVPAYKKFLIDNNVNSHSIKTIDDFKKLPIITKDNYLRKYKYIDLFPKRDIQSTITYAATSGSTGEPFYFPRSEVHDQKYELATRLIFENQFETKKKSTLVIMGFGLGIWIGGIMTYKVLYQLAINGHKISIIPTGPNREQFLMAIKKFGHLYDQIILMGYPPFIKDILEDGKEFSISWNNYNIKIFTAAEGFSEKFKEYLSKKAYLKNRLSDIVNLYGTVEIGVMGHETTFTNLILRLVSKNKKFFKELFPKTNNISTLCQYYPHLVYFEEVKIDNKNEIIATGYGSSIPLIRYRFNDFGGIISYKTMMKKLNDYGIDLTKEKKRYDINHKILPLPFVYVYGRSDFAVVFRGANIYSEELKLVLDNKNLSKFITGRFTMIRKEDKKLKQILEINVELKKGIKPLKEISKKVLDMIIKELCKNNSEFNNEYTSAPNKATPKIVLHKYESQKYFGRQGKQKWVDK